MCLISWCRLPDRRAMSKSFGLNTWTVSWVRGGAVPSWWNVHMKKIKQRNRGCIRENTAPELKEATQATPVNAAVPDSLDEGCDQRFDGQVVWQGRVSHKAPGASVERHGIFPLVLLQRFCHPVAQSHRVGGGYGGGGPDIQHRKSVLSQKLSDETKQNLLIMKDHVFFYDHNHF